MNIIMVIALIFILAVYVSNRTAAKANGNLLLGVTLPSQALNDKAVNGIVKKYRLAHSLNTIAFLALTVPVLFMYEYLSLLLIYLLLWISALFYLNQIIFNKYFSELYALKRKNEWWAGTQNIISVDTEVSRLKNTFMLSGNWFAFPFVMSMLPIIYAATESPRVSFWVTAIAGMTTVIFYFLIYLVINKIRTKTYSENTKINLALNHVFKREWSRCLVVLAVISSCFFAAMLFILRGNEFTPFINAIIMVFAFLIIFVPVIISYNKIRDVRNKILLLENETVYTDDDQFWQGGLYNNPNDSNTFVEKRAGYGLTVNIASRGGKILIASIIPAVILWLGLAVYLLPLDFGTVILNISKQTATINAPWNRFAFSADEIRDVSLTYNFPAAGRVNRVSHGRIISGISNVTGYGESNVFVFRGNAPYIVIKLESGRIFLNGSTREETAAFYSELRALLPSR
ncbi:MAG: hypothetical protein FWB91_00680 [Defluviitaleaceae bacterium]|nr:hypothetical protein [Defluviitaleaceae bacterium]